jgi:hypothetical protein
VRLKNRLAGGRGKMGMLRCMLKDIFSATGLVTQQSFGRLKYYWGFLVIKPTTCTNFSNFKVSHLPTDALFITLGKV